LRRFTCGDLLRFNNINLDVLTETYNLGFYLQYLSTWPEYFMVEEAPHSSGSSSSGGEGGRLTSYIMGKAEGKGEKWHGHVTAVTVAPEYRRLGRAKLMMDLLEEVSNEGYHAYFVDLFVRVSNTLAIRMYEKFGYSVYRQVLGYYSGEEDAYGRCEGGRERGMEGGGETDDEIQLISCLLAALPPSLSSSHSHRHAESPAKRRATKEYSSTSAPRHARGA
jgi:N-terminal acetyltransferase B complex catalytic subunit